LRAQVANALEPLTNLGCALRDHALQLGPAATGTPVQTPGAE
jgi:hypothetical protein